MKASDFVAKYLAEHKVSIVFEFIGGAIVHLVDSISQEPRLRRISMHHEQSAGFAAEAVSRMGSGIGVAMATSGPGALNLLTAIGSCYFDSVPCIFITGQVNTYEYKGASPVRQVGFQETDIVSVARPLTKYAVMVEDPRELQRELAKAFAIATEGRPGPVLIDIPMNVQREDITPVEIFPEEIQQRPNIAEFAKKVVASLEKASRPLILVGGGVRASGAVDCLRGLVRNTGIPVVSSLMGLDVLPHDDELYQGMIGSYGNRNANMAVNRCDWLLVLGSRLDTRQTGTLPQTFAREAQVYWVDVDSAELERGHVVIAENLCAHLMDFLPEFEKQSKDIRLEDWKLWRDSLEIAKRTFFYPAHSKDATPENRLMERLSSICPERTTVCVDVGQHQMWAAQSFIVREHQRFLTSGGMGAMGFSLPTAIGAALSHPEATALVIVGDGSVQVNIQDFNTIAREKLPIKIVLLDNGCLGMVRQFQEVYFEGRTFGTVKGYSSPDIVAIAEAYGLSAISARIEDVSDDQIEWLFAESAPKLLHIVISSCSQVQPKLIVNHPIDDMYPSMECQKEMFVSSPHPQKGLAQ